MRVSIVTETFPPEVNGVAMTVGRLVEGLLSRDHEVLLIRPKQHPEDLPKQERNFREILVTGIPLPKYPSLKFGVPAFWPLLSSWVSHQPDVVHVVTEGPLGWAAVMMAKSLNLPVTSSFHTNFHSYAQHYGVGFLEPMTAGYLRFLHNATAATLAPTKALITELADCGYKNLALLPRGVDMGLFTPKRRSASLRATWGVSDDDLVVLHVGRLAAEKNVALVMAAFAEIAKQMPHAKLVMVGDGPIKDDLRQSCPGAVFTGNKTAEELAGHYASGDLFLFPSVTETYGNVTSEAMASGLCVLAYDYAAAKELIDNGKNGAVVPLPAEADFIAAAVALATDAERRQAIAKQARASIAHLDWQFVYDAFIAKLQDVARQHHNVVELTPNNVNLLPEPLHTWGFPEIELESVPVSSDNK